MRFDKRIGRAFQDPVKGFHNRIGSKACVACPVEEAETVRRTGNRTVTPRYLNFPSPTANHNIREQTAESGRSETVPTVPFSMRLISGGVPPVKPIESLGTISLGYRLPGRVSCVGHGRALLVKQKIP